jgi:hypothetical protein
MITTTLVVILGALLLFVLMKLNKRPGVATSQTVPPGPPPVDLANLQPADTKVGDVISVAGAGDQMTDLDFTADRCIWVEAGSRRWFEISGPYRERRVTMRVSADEDGDVSIQNDARKLTVDDLGLSEQDLADIDERQNTADNFEFDNKTWLYRLSREVRTRRNDQQQVVGYYYWEFREQGGPGLLTVRKPEGEPFAVALFQEIKPGDVTIYRSGGVRA